MGTRYLKITKGTKKFKKIKKHDETWLKWGVEDIKLDSEKHTKHAETLGTL